VLGALGVVFGDIGTSPLYAMKESFHEHVGRQLEVSAPNVLGLLSLVFWSLMFVIGLKYLRFVMRADNHGEGGILALTALISPTGSPTGRTRWLVLLGLFGAALLYGDGVITPAISVLSAVEGTKVISPALESWVIPIAIVILVGLFSIQRWGTHKVGAAFGPIMVVWFTTLGVLGVVNIAHNPGVLRAVNPVEGARFMVDNGWTGFLVLGAVFLVVTGGEALYADMGHFGRRPIIVAWYGIALPGLLLNYFGQGAMLLKNPENVDNPFYKMAPSWSLVPLVILSTMATVIASQALISGAFSLTRQAVQLGYLPRMKITHTNDSEEGQIYVPFINWLLLVGCIGVVIGFRTSTNLAAAYGLAVTGTMAITTVLFYRVLRDRMGWSALTARSLCALFLIIDLAFLGANIPKIPSGGWFPIVVGVLLLIVLTTWFTGRKITAERIAHRAMPLEQFVERASAPTIVRGPGVGVYLGSNPLNTPQSLASHLRHAGVLPAHVCILAIIVQSRPHVDPDDQLVHEDLGGGFHLLKFHAGFSDDLNVPALLEHSGAEAVGVDFAQASYVLGRETYRVTRRPGMAMWRERLFVIMIRNARTADAYFGLPPDQTIELGVQVEL